MRKDNLSKSLYEKIILDLKKKNRGELREIFKKEVLSFLIDKNVTKTKLKSLKSKLKKEELKKRLEYIRLEFIGYWTISRIVIFNTLFGV